MTIGFPIKEFDRIFIDMPHKSFIRHTYIYQCGGCKGEWKINEAINIDRLNCPHCGVNDYVEFVLEDQRKRNNNRWE